MPLRKKVVDCRLSELALEKSMFMWVVGAAAQTILQNGSKEETKESSSPGVRID